MCLEQNQQEHKSRFGDTNPEIQKKKKNSKSKPSQINDKTSKSSNINNKTT